MVLITIGRRLFSISHSVTDSSSLDERKVPRQGPPNRYCACTNLMCNCCREFSLAVVPIKGPGEFCFTINKLDALISQILFRRILYDFGQFLCPSLGIFRCTHSNGICHTRSLTACKRDQDDPGCKLSANLYDIYHCCVYSEKLLMMDRGTVRNT